MDEFYGFAFNVDAVTGAVLDALFAGVVLGLGAFAVALLQRGRR